ncbi:MAG: hypothetical protein ACK56F_16230, partial [bacterium]
MCHRARTMCTRAGAISVRSEVGHSACAGAISVKSEMGHSARLSRAIGKGFVRSLLVREAYLCEPSPVSLCAVD